LPLPELVRHKQRFSRDVSVPFTTGSRVSQRLLTFNRPAFGMIIAWLTAGGLTMDLRSAALGALSALVVLFPPPADAVPISAAMDLTALAYVDGASSMAHDFDAWGVPLTPLSISASATILG